jgi:DNA-directed RNA polymerase III subunit RPC4
MGDGGGGSGSGGGGGGAGAGGRGKVKSQLEGVVDLDSSADENEDPTFDIEYIGQNQIKPVKTEGGELEAGNDDIDEDEDGPVSGKRKREQDQKGKGKHHMALGHRPKPILESLRPVRMERLPTREEEAEQLLAAAKKKSTRAFLKKNASTLQNVDIEIPDDEEPDTNDNDHFNHDAMDLDTHLEPNQDGDGSGDGSEPQFIKEQPSSPELHRRPKKPHPKSTRTRTRDLNLKPAHPNETHEERAERIRVTGDANRLTDFFENAGILDDDEDDGDETDTLQTGEDPEIDYSDGGKLFLVQLPPLTPFLVDAALSSEPEVKTEPGVDKVAAGGGGAAPGPGTEKTGRPKLEIEGMLTASEPTRLPAGLVGKLRVHRSGKVSMDWGGTDMDVRYGTEVDFLQDAVLVESRTVEDGVKDDDGKDGADKEKVRPVGKTYALGQVRSKMVLIPDWAKLYD